MSDPVATLVAAWGRWESVAAHPPKPKRVTARWLAVEAAAKETALSAFDIPPSQLHDKITELRRAGDDVDTAVRLSIAILTRLT